MYADDGKKYSFSKTAIYKCLYNEGLWPVLKWKSVLWSDESKFDILVGIMEAVAKEYGDLPQACDQLETINKNLAMPPALIQYIFYHIKIYILLGV